MEEWHQELNCWIDKSNELLEENERVINSVKEEIGNK